MTQHFSGAQGRPVRVVLPNGMEIQGVALSDDTLEAPGGIGMFLESYDILTIDGERREITGLTSDMGYDPAKHPGGRIPPNAPVDYAYTRVTHRKPQ